MFTSDIRTREKCNLFTVAWLLVFTKKLGVSDFSVGGNALLMRDIRAQRRGRSELTESQNAQLTR